MDNKITISRAFGRTWQIKDFEPAKFFSSRSVEITADTPMAEQQEMSNQLHNLCMMDVAQARDEYGKLAESFKKGLNVREFTGLRDALGRGETMDLEEYVELNEKATAYQQDVLNEFKKFYNKFKKEKHG